MLTGSCRICHGSQEEAYELIMAKEEVEKSVSSHEEE